MRDILEELEDFYEYNSVGLDFIDSLSQMKRLMREMEGEIIELREYKQKYYDLVDERFKEAQQSSANILSAILAGAKLSNNEGED